MPLDAQPAPCVRFDGVAVEDRGDAAPLRNLSFSISPGSFHIVTGAAGSGKTTLLRLMSLSRTPSRGIVQLFGRDVSALTLSERTLLRRRVGAVFRLPPLIEHLSLRDNVALAPRVVGRPRSDYEPQVEALLAWLGLAARAEARPDELSDNERRRLVIARAVANRPDLLLVDEPDADVDAPAALRLLRWLSELHAAGTTVVMTSRDAAMAARSGYPVIDLRDGRATVLEAAAPTGAA